MDFLPDTYGERHDSERPKASNLSAWRIGTEPWGASRACTKMRPMANGQSSRSTCSIKACRTRKGQIAGISRDLPFICPFGGPQAAVKTIGRADHRGFPGFALYLPFRRSSSCRKDHQKGRLSGFPGSGPFGGPQAAVKTIGRADRRDFPGSALSVAGRKAVLTRRTKKAPSYDGAFLM